MMSQIDITATLIHFTSLISPAILIGLTLVYFGLLTIKWLISVCLQYKYGENFIGMLDGADNLFASESISNYIINFTSIHRTDKNFDEFRTIVKRLIFEKCFKNQELFPKLTSVRKSFLGYNFMVKSSITCEQVFRIFHVETDINHNNFMEIMETISEQNFPNNPAGFFEVILLDKQIESHEYADADDNKFVLILRFHHSLGDGFAMVRFLLEHISESSHINLFSKILKKNNKKYPDFDLLGLIKSGYELSLALTEYLEHFFLKYTARNLLSSYKITGQKLIAWYLEPEAKHVDYVKKIKKRNSLVSFSDIILASFSEALSSHLIGEYKNSEYMSCLVPIGFNPTQDLVLTNNFSLIPIRLPTNKDTFEDKLRIIKKQTRAAAKSKIFIIDYFAKKLAALFPQRIFLYFLEKFFDNSVTISIIPMPENFSLFRGINVEEIITLFSAVKNLGIAIIVGSFNNRFQLTMLVDKGLIGDRNKAVNILRDVLKNIETYYQSVAIDE